jgi:hypothetical protein
LLGLIAERIAARQVGRELQQSLANVRAMVESEMRFRCFVLPGRGILTR